MMILPKMLYESLPYAYLGIGGTAMTQVEVMLGQLCGLLLLSAGALIWALRYNYRHLSSPQYPIGRYRRDLRKQTRRR